MIVSLSLTNARRFDQFSLELPEAEGVVLVGPNGTGKTTIVEALLVPTRGFLQGVRAATFIRQGTREGAIVVRARKDTLHYSVEVLLSASGSRLRIDGKEAHRAEVKRIMPFASYFPQDIALILGGPEERRGYLDRTLAEALPAYEGALRVYRRILAERNTALRKGVPDDELDIYDTQLASAGTVIHEKRVAYLPVLGEFLQACSAFFGLGRVRLRLATSVRVADDYEESFRECLVAAREHDRKEGTTTVGPHRDGVEISLEGRSARYSASYGERKMLALALRLTECSFLSEVTQAPYGFIADDLFSELDENRKRAIVSYLATRNIYTIATATEIPSPGQASFGWDVVRLRGDERPPDGASAES